jgi:hypothetical protein
MNVRGGYACGVDAHYLLLCSKKWIDRSLQGFSTYKNLKKILACGVDAHYLLLCSKKWIDRSLQGFSTYKNLKKRYDPVRSVAF